MIIAKINNIFRNYCPDAEYVVSFSMSGIRIETASEKMLSHSLFINNGGDSLKIGVIGAGRAGTSVARYLSTSSVHVLSGFYSERYEDAVISADFCHTKSFKDLSQLVSSSDTLFIAVTDSQIKNVWDCIDKTQAKHKIICHFSGSLTSDVFTCANDYSVYTGSIHPVYAFSDKFNSYKALNEAVFTAEGCEKFLCAMKNLFSEFGNKILTIDKSHKALYHAAASMASNHLIGLLQSVTDMLTQCGFTEEDARLVLKVLMRENLHNALQFGTTYALTGPIERGDILTVEKHLSVLNFEQQTIYKALGKEILKVAEKKHPDDGFLTEKYRCIERILSQ